MVPSKTLLMTLIVLSTLILLVHSNNSTSDDQVTDEETASSSMNLALVPLYKMTNTFIQVVFPSGIRVDTIQSAIKSLQKDKVEPWPLTQTILNGYYGFATCVVVGVLLLVLMPFIGFFCCCCRLCNNCGGRTHENDPKHAKCKRITCAGLLLILTLITVGGMVMVFFSATRLHQLVDEDIVQKQLTTEINKLNHTVHQTVNQDILDQTEEILDDLNATVFTFLDDASNSLTGRFLNLSHVEQPVDHLAFVLDNVNQTLDTLIVSLVEFESVRNVTAANYTVAQQLLNETVARRGASTVEDLVNTINGFSVEAVINNLKTGAKKTLNDIPNLRDAYTQVNKTIAEEIEKKFNSSKKDIQNTVDTATEDVQSQVQSLTDSLLSSFGQVTSQTKSISTTVDGAKVYAEYGWYACLAFGGIIAFITLLYLIGLMCGCGERPGPDANTCNKGCGANFLLAAVGFTFIFYTLLMLITVLLFSIGSLTSSQLCWTIQNPNQTAQALKDSDFVITNNLTLGGVIGSYSDCLNKKSIDSIIEGLQFGDFNKQSLLNELDKQLDVQKFKDIIDSINISTGAFDFSPADFNNSLNELSKYDGFNASSIPNLESQVDDIKRKLNSSISAIQVAGLILSPSDTAKLNNASSIFEASRDSGIDLMVQYANDVRGELTKMNSFLDQLKNASQDAFNAVIKAEQTVKTNGSELIKQALNDLVDNLVAVVRQDASDGIDQLFGIRCDKLANNLKSTANVFCETVLNPWNGLWFSLGWSLIMLIPCIIIALVVTSLFRRREPYEYKEDLNRDYDSEHIPLERQPLTSTYYYR